jgi:hypothetical protein
LEKNIEKGRSKVQIGSKGHFSSHSTAGREGAICFQGRTPPPFQLANLIFQRAFADSIIHERWPSDFPL